MTVVVIWGYINKTEVKLLKIKLLHLITLLFKSYILIFDTRLTVYNNKLEKHLEIKGFHKSHHLAQH